jgi:hypothetical protein
MLRDIGLKLHDIFLDKCLNSGTLRRSKMLLPPSSLAATFDFRCHHNPLFSLHRRVNEGPSSATPR